ncbi:bidirectional sugar transporter NEC1-like [Senna tora]|uniref:Bidirectional sugar transporter SWEET n=1 Tax=Senna tora TaxID=362788 RepID=A0A834SKA8_9FABA|nr:bidirectional sugar transporter NEC1-like [Senna tora]
MVSWSEKELVFVFGVLGNIVSFLVFLAPLPTMYRIWKKKSSEGFESIPYVVALLSAMLLVYYGFLKNHAILILTINAIGCTIELAYLIFYFIYAPRPQKISTLVLLGVFNIGGFAFTLLITNFIVTSSYRLHTLGWICAIFNIAVFAAPLTIMRRVIKTKSVKYMPFSLSLFLTLCATMWFFYGLFDKDYYIMVPNVLGFVFGVAQMMLYMIYKDTQPQSECSAPPQSHHSSHDVHLHNQL